MIDQAENERTIVRTPEGNVLRVALPARVATRLTAGKVVREKKRSVLDERPVVSFGAGAVLRGKLVDPAGNPLARVPVEVLERVDVAGSAWRLLGSAQTSAKGEYTFRVGAGPSRRLRFTYGGSPTMQPSSTGGGVAGEGGGDDPARSALAPQR